jgi:DNA-binding beta-propeller fold protein YncE
LRNRYGRLKQWDLFGFRFRKVEELLKIESSRPLVFVAFFIASSCFGKILPMHNAAAQEDASNPASAEKTAESTTAASETTSVQYPISVAVAPDGSSILVDLNLPGVWRIPAGGGVPQLVYRGTNLLRKPMNRPRCVAVLQDGAILVGDTATREIYRIAQDGSGEPQPLTSGYLGIPNSIGLTADGNIIIADLESHFVYSVPVAGGKPTLFSKTNARGIHVAADGRVLAVLAPAGPPQLVEVKQAGDDLPIVNESAFQFPHNVVVAEDGTMFVTDGYAKAVWKVVAGSAPEKLVEGEPLKNPVGIAIDSNGNLLVADPHAKQLFGINPSTAEIKPLIQ